VIFRGFLAKPVYAWWAYDRYDLIKPLENLTIPAENVSQNVQYDLLTLGPAGTVKIGLDADSGMLNRLVGF
jgi:hypothetical protein